MHRQGRLHESSCIAFSFRRNNVCLNVGGDNASPPLFYLFDLLKSLLQIAFDVVNVFNSR